MQPTEIHEENKLGVINFTPDCLKNIAGTVENDFLQTEIIVKSKRPEQNHTLWFRKRNARALWRWIYGVYDF